MYRTLARVALPIALQSLIGSSLSLVDNLMVGSLGEKELAAVGVAIQLYFINWMVLYGFTSGSTTFMAQFFGAGDLKNIRKTIGFAMCVCVVTGLLFFVAAMFFPLYVVRIFTDIAEIEPLAVTYVRVGAPCFLALSITIPLNSALRSTQQTQIPMLIASAIFVINTCLNYVFIFGHFGAPRLGVAGAALATVIARCTELCLVLYVVFGRKNMIAGSLKEFFGWSKEFASRIVHNAVPTTLNETLWGLGTALYVAAYARVGVTEYASVQAGNVINNLFVMAAFSIGDATLILVGQRLGAGELDYGYALGKKLLRFGTLVGFVFGLGLILVSKPLIAFFGFTPEGERYTFYILVVYGLTMWLTLFTGISITGTLRAGGDTRFAMLSEVLCVWLIGVPMAFLATHWLHLPIYIAVLLVKMEDGVKFFVLLKRFVSGKWIKNVIRGL